MHAAPGPLDPTSTQTIAGLYTETFLPSGTPRGIALVSHGYQEHCGRYREVANAVVKVGWAALTYDVRGHGRSPGERGYIERFSVYLDDLAEMQAAARKLAPGAAPLVLVGHSHGSLITLRALADERPPAVAAAVVASPYLALKLPVPGHQRLLARVASFVAPKLAQPGVLRVEDLTRDPGKQAERRADTACFNVATSRWFTESTAAQDYVLANASRIKVPTTWLVGGDDPIADPARSRMVANKIAGATYHDLRAMRHEVFNEIERGDVFALLTGALAQTLAPAVN